MNPYGSQPEPAEADCPRSAKIAPGLFQILGETALVVGVLAFAYFQLRVPRQDAAEMPQESPKYAVAAWNLYQTGRYELTINHKGYPSWGGLGYGFLIVPSYWLFGPDLANAHHTQTALAVLTCAAVYLVLRRGFGRLPAAMAVLLLPLYADFRECAKMNDTNLPVAFFLVAGLLIFDWILRSERRGWLKWLLWGLCAGWGVAARTSSMPVFLALTLALAWLSDRPWRELVRNLFLAMIGALPLLIPVMWYNHHYCGSWFRDPHAYWESAEFDNLAHSFGLRFALGSPAAGTENLSLSGNLVFYGREIACQFSRWPSFVVDRRSFMHVLTYCLTGVMAVGVGCVCRRSRVSAPSRHLLQYAIISCGTLLLFYSLKSGGNVRYVVPLVPFAVIFVTVGVADVARWFFRHPPLGLSVPLFFLLLGVPPFRWWQRIPRNAGELFPKTQVLESMASKIESNAVVLGSENWELINHYVIRGTAREFVPLGSTKYFQVQPTPPRINSMGSVPPPGDPDEGPLENGSVNIFSFSAAEDPPRIQELLLRGLPVYAIAFPAETYFHRNDQEFLVLNKFFILQPHLTLSVIENQLRQTEGTTFVVLWKVQSRPLLFQVQ